MKMWRVAFLVALLGLLVGADLLDLYVEHMDEAMGTSSSSSSSRVRRNLLTRPYFGGHYGLQRLDVDPHWPRTAALGDNLEVPATATKVQRRKNKNKKKTRQRRQLNDKLFNRAEQLDDKGDFLLEWDSTKDDVVTFKATARTKGYFDIGFGAGADFVVAWVDDHSGEVHLLVRIGIDVINMV